MGRWREAADASMPNLTTKTQEVAMEAIQCWSKEYMLGLLDTLKGERADLYAILEEHFAGCAEGECDGMDADRKPSAGETCGAARNKAVVSFRSVLTDTQVEALVDLVNDLHIFSKLATVEVLSAFFRCEMTGLQVRNLRLFCALMTALSNHELIGPYWQAPIYRNNMLLSPQKDGFVNRRDLIVANYAVNNVVRDERIEKINQVVRSLAT